jgi:hypothetical protein
LTGADVRFHRFRRTPWEAWALGVTGVVLVLAWGIFGLEGVLWVLSVPVAVVALWILRAVQGPRTLVIETDADFERIRRERIRRRDRQRAP